MLSFETSAEDAGKRLDQYLQAILPQYSRSRLQDWIRLGRVLVNGGAQKPSSVLHGDERVDVDPGELPALKAFAEDIPVDVLYADDNVIAVNKPAGIAVHAGAGRHSGTLVNALLHHFQSLSSISGEERPGIVHRLDRETSGVLLVARTDAAHRNLAEQFRRREVEKTYLTLVQGRLERNEGRIESKITRDPVRRTRMTARLQHGRDALTDYEVLERLPKHTYLQVTIGTGRTHQIRVHMSSLRHPVAGDTLYGAAAVGYSRFFLHAHRISFNSPSTGGRITVESPLPPDLVQWLDQARSEL